jgi:uncharacterized protein YajQ (UPF0234 family)
MKRGIGLKNLDYGKVEPASHGAVRQVITIKKGISKEVAKDVVAAIKGTKLRYRRRSWMIRFGFLQKIKMTCKQLLAA